MSWESTVLGFPALIWQCNWPCCSLQTYKLLVGVNLVDWLGILSSFFPFSPLAIAWNNSPQPSGFIWIISWSFARRRCISFVCCSLWWVWWECSSPPAAFIVASCRTIGEAPSGFPWFLPAAGIIIRMIAKSLFLPYKKCSDAWMCNGRLKRCLAFQRDMRPALNYSRASLKASGLTCIWWRICWCSHVEACLCLAFLSAAVEVGKGQWGVLVLPPSAHWGTKSFISASFCCLDAFRF